MLTGYCLDYSRPFHSAFQISLTLLHLSIRVERLWIFVVDATVVDAKVMIVDFHKVSEMKSVNEGSSCTPLANCP